MDEVDEMEVIEGYLASTIPLLGLTELGGEVTTTAMMTFVKEGGKSELKGRLSS